MAKIALPNASEHYPDGFARDMLAAVRSAVQEFLSDIQDQGGSSHFSQKLSYYDTDISKFSNVVMRCTQHLASIAGLQEETASYSYSVYEVAHALHQWRRQLAVHRGFIRWSEQQGPRRLPAQIEGRRDRRSRGDDNEEPPESEMTVLPTDADALPANDWLQRAILHNKHAQARYCRTLERHPGGSRGPSRSKDYYFRRCAVSWSTAWWLASTSVPEKALV